MSACEQIQAELSAYLDGELNAAERAAVDAHLHDCAPCRALMGELSQVQDSLHDLPHVKAPASLLPNIQKQISQPAVPSGNVVPISATSAPHLKSVRPEPRKRNWAPVVLSLVAMLMLGLLIFTVLPREAKKPDRNVAIQTSPAKNAAAQPKVKSAPPAERDKDLGEVGDLKAADRAMPSEEPLLKKDRDGSKYDLLDNASGSQPELEKKKALLVESNKLAPATRPAAPMIGNEAPLAAGAVRERPAFKDEAAKSPVAPAPVPGRARAKYAEVAEKPAVPSEPVTEDGEREFEKQKDAAQFRAEGRVVAEPPAKSPLTGNGVNERIAADKLPQHKKSDDGDEKQLADRKPGGSPAPEASRPASDTDTFKRKEILSESTEGAEAYAFADDQAATVVYHTADPQSLLEILDGLAQNSGGRVVLADGLPTDKAAAQKADSVEPPASVRREINEKARESNAAATEYMIEVAPHEQAALLAQLRALKPAQNTFGKRSQEQDADSSRTPASKPAITQKESSAGGAKHAGSDLPAEARRTETAVAGRKAEGKKVPVAVIRIRIERLPKNADASEQPAARRE